MDPHDDEAPKDPGAQNVGPYDEKDFEGHRAHSVFVGVHIPVERRHSHRRHKHHHRSSECSAPEDERPSTPPAQRVQFILGEEIDDGTQSHPLFSEMEELVGDGDDMEWKETARWIKFEEDVEEGGNRWSKPHVATLSLHSLFELRSLLLNGTVLLDMDAISVEQIADLVIDNMVNAGTLPADKKDKVRETLLKRHRHQHQRKKHVLPLIRSFADIGRNHSSSKNGCFNLMCVQPSRNSSSLNVHVVEDTMSSQKRNGSYISVPG